MIKVFDSDIEKITPYHFQSFIGHTFGVRKIFFNPNNNSQCFSVGGRDGIHMWTFRGDISDNYDNYAEELQALKEKTQQRMTYKGEPMKDPEEQVEEAKEPEQEEIDKENINTENIERDSQKDVQETDSKQEYKEFQETDIKPDPEQFIQEGQEHNEGEGSQISDKLSENECPPISILYNGVNVQGNIISIKDKNLMIYTSETDIVLQNKDSANQRVLENSHNGQHISALAISRDNTLLASCSSAPDEEGTASIIIRDVENDFNKKLELRSHKDGIDTLLFSYCGEFLISQGNSDDKTLAIWHIPTGELIKSTLCPLYYSGISLLENDLESKLMFATVGREAFRLWKISETHELLFYDVELPEAELNLTSISVSPVLPEPYNTSVVLIGTEEGDVIICSPHDVQFLAKVNRVMTREITIVECKRDAILLADSAGNLVRHSIDEGKPLFTEPGTVLIFDGPVIAISFDKNLMEGHVGTIIKNFDSKAYFYIFFLKNISNDEIISKFHLKFNKLQENVYQQQFELCIFHCL